MPGGSGSTRERYLILLLGVVFAALCGAGALLARRNLKLGKGDVRGATRLAVWTGIVHMALWLSRTHFVPGGGGLGLLFIALCTSTAYGVVIWTFYMALEPYARRHWPQTLISWTRVLSGRLRDPAAGRDTLIGVALGVGWALLVAVVNAWLAQDAGSPMRGSYAVLADPRAMLAACIRCIPHSIRDSLLFLLALFLLRALLRNQWVAGGVFISLFSLINALPSDEPLLAFAVSLVLYGMVTFVMLRRGLLAVAVGIFVLTCLTSLPPTSDPSAWYFPGTVFAPLVVLALTAWAFHAAIGGRRLWKQDLFE